MRAAAGPTRAVLNGPIMKIFRYLLPLVLTPLTSHLQAEAVAPLKPGPRFDYSKFAFQPESWKSFLTALAF